MKKIFAFLFGWMINDKLKELRLIEKALNDKIATTQPIYTTIKPFNGMNTDYYGWVCSLLSSDEYKFFVFDLRENVIREMVGQTDEKELLKASGRLDMLNAIGNYFLRYKHEYEDSIQRHKEGSAK
jgi:hypothetical protein